MLVAFPAAAAGPSARVVLDDPEGSARERNAVLESIEAGLTRKGWEVSDTENDGHGMVLEVQVRAAAGAHRVELELRDGAGRSVARAEATCEICGLSELQELIADRSATVVGQYELDLDAAPILRVEVLPSHAEIRIDGRDAGASRVEVELDPGEHVVEASADGYVVQRRTVGLERGTERDLTIRLSPVDAPPPKRPRGFTIGGGLAIALGLASMGAGVALVVVDGDPVQRNCNPDPDGDCARLHDTQAMGTVALALGAASIGSGVALLLLGRKQARQRRTQATLGGFAVRF